MKKHNDSDTGVIETQKTPDSWEDSEAEGSRV